MTAPNRFKHWAAFGIAVTVGAGIGVLATILLLAFFEFVYTHLASWIIFALVCTFLCLCLWSQNYLVAHGAPWKPRLFGKPVPRCEGPHDMQPTDEFGDGALHCTRCGVADYQL